MKNRNNRLLSMTQGIDVPRPQAIAPYNCPFQLVFPLVTIHVCIHCLSAFRGAATIDLICPVVPPCVPTNRISDLKSLLGKLSTSRAGMSSPSIASGGG